MPQSMKLIMFNPKQSAELPGKASERFALRILTTDSEREEAYRLRYKAYEDILGEAGRNLGGIFRDAFDDLPTTVTIGAYDDGRLIASMRLCFSRPWEDLKPLPCAAYYPALADIKKTASGAIMEVSRLAIDPAITNTSYRTTLYASLVRTSFLASEAVGVSFIVIAMREAWVRFYRYMLGFEVVGEPAAYPPGDFNIWLLGGSIAQARLRQRMQNAFFRLTPEEVQNFRRQLVPLLARAEAAA